MTGTSNAPTAAEIDQWCRDSETLRTLASRAFVPGTGIDLKVYAVGFSLNGAHIFFPLADEAFDPTTNPIIARQLETLRANSDGVAIRYYHVKLPIGTLYPEEAVGSEMDQQRVNDPRNWARPGAMI